MKKIILYSLLALSLSSIAHASAYDPSQLKQFQTTGQCASCDLSNANLSYGEYDSANLSEALLVESNISDTKFPNTNFSGAMLIQTNAENIMASGADFTNANLSSANLAYATLSRVNFTGANLSGTDLSHANLIQAKITDDQLKTVSSLSCAIMPDGTQHASDQGGRC